MINLVRYSSILKEQNRPVKFILSRLLLRSGLCKYFKINRNTYKIYFHPTSISLSCWLNPEDRYNDERFFYNLLKSGDNVVDIGANIGMLTLAATYQVGERGKVISIEAHPRTFKFLKRNIALNNFKNIVCCNIALGEKEGYINFSNKNNDDENEVTLNTDGIKIPIEKLDNLLKDFKAEITLLKVDVEGFELFVFKGADKVITQVKHIYFESWEDNYIKFGYSTSDIINFLNERGFIILKIKNNKFETIDNNYVSTKCENLIATRDLLDLEQRLI